MFKRLSFDVSLQECECHHRLQKGYSMLDLKELLKKGPLILDGGMGTQLQALGITDSERPEQWNLTHPEDITHIHKAYIEAGKPVLVEKAFSYDSVTTAEILNMSEEKNIFCGEAMWVRFLPMYQMQTR